jgi:hypothetical protein
MSLLQGGSGFPFFAEQVFHYFVTGICTGAAVPLEIIPCSVLQSIIEKIHEAQTDEHLQSLFVEGDAQDYLLNTGFRKPIQQLSLMDKSTIESSLIDYHCFIKVKAEMDQFMEGLDQLGILSVIRSSPELVKELFVCPMFELTAGI